MYYASLIAIGLATVFPEVLGSSWDDSKSAAVQSHALLRLLSDDDKLDSLMALDSRKHNGFLRKVLLDPLASSNGVISVLPIAQILNYDEYAASILATGGVEDILGGYECNIITCALSSTGGLFGTFLGSNKGGYEDMSGSGNAAINLNSGSVMIGGNTNGHINAGGVIGGVYAVNTDVNLQKESNISTNVNPLNSGFIDGRFGTAASSKTPTVVDSAQAGIANTNYLSSTVSGESVDAPQVVQLPLSRSNQNHGFLSGILGGLAGANAVTNALGSGLNIVGQLIGI